MKLSYEKELADSDQHPQRTATATSWFPSLFFAGLIAALLVAIGWLLGGKIFAEKMATSLVMPVGLVWAILAGRVLHCTVAGRLLSHKMTLIAWLVLWGAGTSPISNYLTRYLETRVTSYNPERDQPLDVVVVLGGCTTTGPWRAQTAESGDRIVLAAELFLSGKTKQLVTTGEALSGFSKGQPSPADHAIELWTKLGIPREAIKTAPGRNTSEEIRHVKGRVAELAGPRIGLLTSGTHIARAVRLARAANLDVVPIAADVKTADIKLSILDVIPQAYWLNRLSMCQHELMARLLSR